MTDTPAAATGEPRRPTVTTADRVVAGRTLRIYAPERPSGAGLVWLHGGGFSRGDIDMPEADWVARELAARGIAVASLDYRLAAVAGEAAFGTMQGRHYPAASDDALAAWEWAMAHADELGVDPARVGFGGASAGANIAVGATLRMLADGRRTPGLMVLAYPTLLAEQPAPAAELRAKLEADPVADRFGPEVVLAMYENYLGGTVAGAPSAAIPGLASAEELAGFPPTVMVNSDADELRVSGEAFADQLRAAGIEVAAATEPGTTHGHLNRPNEGTAARDTIDRFASALLR
ncbi:alpha/beta hydrolase [Microbacterium halophytorum]|uniref:alpha/beta hydrolase n=1 Tax=Microbacterium halophytorum TaxID=2067568 RepID=UPI000CFDAF15|nr:alpha/beta hydrolase fold domain-containing protein [Microbacterium halophytorum]